ncbi:hypothetical protein [Actinomyces oris]|nr:hypothetical protein [Actinomyces oris]
MTGQFVGRQTVLGAAILCALAAWFGVSPISASTRVWRSPGWSWPPSA